MKYNTGFIVVLEVDETFNSRVLRACLVLQCSHPVIDPAINDALRIVTGCLRSTLADNLFILECIQPADLRHSGATFSLARRAMELGHLLHSALTCLSSAYARRLKSRHPFVPAAQLITSSDNNNIRETLWVDLAEWLEYITRLHTFIPDTGTHPLKWPFQEQLGSDLIASTPVSGVSAPAYKNGVWPHLWSVSVALKNKLTTMLSTNVQSIDLIMDWTACRFWMMRQSNGCSTSTPRSSAAKQLIATTRSNDEKEDVPGWWNRIHLCQLAGIRYFTQSRSTQFNFSRGLHIRMTSLQASNNWWREGLFGP